MCVLASKTLIQYVLIIIVVCLSTGWPTGDPVKGEYGLTADQMIEIHPKWYHQNTGEGGSAAWFWKSCSQKNKGRIRDGYQTEFLKWFGFTLIQWIPFGQNLGLWSREYHWPPHGGLSINRGLSKNCERIQKVRSGKKFCCWVIFGGWMGIVMIHVENLVLSQAGAALEMTQGGLWSLLNLQYEPRELRLRLQFLVVSLFMFDFPSPSGGFHSHGGPPNSFFMVFMKKSKLTWDDQWGYPLVMSK